ncbi:cap-specific mRNA (nucleoside-2'-O-)-methyltransferase 2 isoform X2 [Parasteatoda tepidariorum]|uniref:cap-specific mRNA (nucleoside-2'-O-)-methyltransferase 2 isoform X2 n=1 Tax=Parasteatoda tepidariorum TaxID=114398 RepID=UPI00077FDACB|nr:cap-specific mRNA (nucleoside-2'-O-)-methyltransferase 2 isoform X2 [Parasteatoda tepidariorum]
MQFYFRGYFCIVICLQLQSPRRLIDFELAKFKKRKHLEWEWSANTLNPYYEGHNIRNVIVDDRLIFPTLKNWYFGESDTGDINDPDYLKNLLLYLGSKNNSISLITADGSINCLHDPSEQELITSELHFKETLIALLSLATKGTFVLKQFTFFECLTISRMYLLNCVFEEVHAFKPFSSKAGNSEVYIVCLGYLGVETFKDHLFKVFAEYGSIGEKALYSLSSIPQSFIEQISACSEYFLALQKQAIEENLQLYSMDTSLYEEKLENVKHAYASHYLRKCEIVGDDTYPSAHLFSVKKQIKTSFHDKQNKNCKLMFYQAIGETFDNLSKLKIMSWKENVLDVDRRLNLCFSTNRKRANQNLELIPLWKVVINRMKSKSYQNWLLTGKKIIAIENSKFCNPYLIHLWNRISFNSEVKEKSYRAVKHCPFDIENVMCLLKEKSEDICITFVSNSENDFIDDPLWSHLKENFNRFSSFSYSEIETQSYGNQILYVNSTLWLDSLHQEITLKNHLTVVMSHIIKKLKIGDHLIICVQSLLMRYTVGLIFLIMSLFDKFVCLLPTPGAPAACGQLWIFKNFQNPAWTERLVIYLETILKIDLIESKEVLQIVPISSLCGSLFYEFILELNNEHMQQRLRSLTICEKNEIKLL